MKKWRIKRNTIKRLSFSVISYMLAAALVVTLLPAAVYEGGIGTTAKAAESVTLQNPRIATDSSVESGQKVTWDCVWFGSYPQAEVVTTEMSLNYTAFDERLLREGDLFVRVQPRGMQTTKSRLAERSIEGCGKRMLHMLTKIQMIIIVEKNAITNGWMTRVGIILNMSQLNGGY